LLRTGRPGSHASRLAPGAGHGRVLKKKKNDSAETGTGFPLGFVYLHDGSFEGMVTAIAVAFTAPDPPDDILAESAYQGTLFDTPFRVGSDPERARLFLDSLRSDFGTGPFRNVLRAFLYDGIGRDLAVCRYLKAAATHGRRIDSCHHLEEVAELHRIAAKVSAEAHRFKGLLRFRELSDRSLYAPFSPDHRVIHLVANHFRTRLAAEKWLIHDVPHRMIAAWAGTELVEWSPTPESCAILAPDGTILEDRLHPNEMHFQELWRTFFRSIAIDSRKNPRLQRQWMPKRYWSHLTEAP
jgi:probable DNA metabolism protein